MQVIVDDDLFFHLNSTIVVKVFKLSIIINAIKRKNTN